MSAVAKSSNKLTRPPRRQHTVSRVVLRNFTRHNEISVYDRQANLIYNKGLNGVFHARLDQWDPWNAESRWAEVESRMPAVYQLLHQRKALQDPAAVDTLRELIAIHWVRSPALRATRERIRDQVKADSIRKLAQRPDLLRRALKSKLGLEPGSQADLDWLNHRVHEEVLAAVGEQMHSDSLATNYEAARQILGRWQVQIGYSDDADFLIGDAPVLTLKNNHVGVGPHQGVALGEANQIMMPVAPKILLALGPEPGVVTMPNSDVRWCNTLQRRGFTRWIGCQPRGAADRELRSDSTIRRL